MWRVWICALLGMVLTPVGLLATMVEADGFAFTRDCGAGSREVIGVHSAVLNLVNPAHYEKTWALNGSAWACNTFFPRQVTYPCTLEANVEITRFLYCNTQSVKKCNRIKDGVYSKETAGEVGGNSFFDQHESTCSGPESCDDGGVGPHGPEAEPEEAEEAAEASAARGSEATPVSRERNSVGVAERGFLTP